MSNSNKVDALVLARYGIVQPALPEDGHLEAKYGIASLDNRGIITSLLPIGEMSQSERHDMYELASLICAA